MSSAEQFVLIFFLRLIISVNLINWSVRSQSLKVTTFVLERLIKVNGFEYQ